MMITGTDFEPQLVLNVAEKLPVDFFDLRVKFPVPPLNTVSEEGET